MPRRASLAASVALVAALVAASTARAEEEPQTTPFVRLEYEVVVERAVTRAEVQRKEPLVPRSESRWVLTLGPRTVQLETDGRRTVLDFAGGREVVVDPRTRRRRPTPLVARVAELEMALAERERMSAVLQEAGISDRALVPSERSIAYGWPSVGDAATVTRVERDAEVAWSIEGEEVARCTSAEHLLDPAQRAALDRALQRWCHLHPEVRAQIVDQGAAPAALTARWFDLGERDTATLRLVAFARDAAAPDAGDDLEREFAKGPVEQLAAGVLHAAERPDPAAVAAELDELALTRRREGRAADALLLQFERSMTDGHDVSSDVRTLLGTSGARERLLALMATIQRANQEPERGLAELDALDRSEFTHPAILDVFRAAALRRLGRHDAAVPALTEALRRRPALVAGYKDLGDVLYDMSQPDAAWLVWEVGRALGPEHAVWRDVAGLEEQLRATYASIL
mgnify:CR=1 FL=1